MKLGDILYGIFILILIFLVISRWQGANALLVSTARASNTLIRTLQGR